MKQKPIKEHKKYSPTRNKRSLRQYLFHLEQYTLQHYLLYIIGTDTFQRYSWVQCRQTHNCTQRTWPSAKLKQFNNQIPRKLREKM